MQGALCQIHHVGVWCTPCLESSLPLSCEPAGESNFWTIDPGDNFQFTRQ